MTNEEAIELLKDLPDRIVSMILPMDKPFDYKQALNLAIKALENEPKKGKWIRITNNTKYVQMWNCSECGRTVEKATVLDPDIFFPFCHCGADMREGDET